MSEKHSQNATIEIEPKSPQNEDQTDADAVASLENINKTNTILPTNETVIQNKEVIINIDSFTDKDAKNNYKITDANATVANNIGNNEYLVYNHYRTQIKTPKTTWVMFQQAGTPLPPGEEPLSYDPSTRNDFVRLVFGIVLLMLLVTASFVAVVLFSDLRDVFRSYGIIMALPAMVLMIGLNYAVACSACTRMFPCNIICLVLAVIGMSIICAYITSRYRTEIVFFALIATCLVVIVCLILACTSFDFTQFFIYIVVIAAAFSAVALMASMYMLISGTYMKMLHLGILLVGTVLNVIILTMELQMILGGRAIELSETDYTLGAFLLYTSVVDIFLKLVQILGILDNF